MPPARLITDASLEFLARRLRFLGYDVAVARGARLDELFEVARRDGRTVLTLSARHPRRFANVPAVRVARADPAVALRALVAEFEPAGAAFSRCPDCNTPLERRLAFEARGEVPGRVTRGATHLHHCPTCGKWYWEGSHTARLRAWLGEAIGRPLATPAPAPGAGEGAPDGGPPREPGR
jgi:uncharacterized protein with PIN domain